MAGERIGLLGRKEVGPPGVCLAADLVIRAALEEVSVTSTPPLLDLPLPEGSGSRLVSGPVLSGVGTVGTQEDQDSRFGMKIKVTRFKTVTCRSFHKESKK